MAWLCVSLWPSDTRRQRLALSLLSPGHVRCPPSGEAAGPQAPGRCVLASSCRASPHLVVSAGLQPRLLVTNVPSVPPCVPDALRQQLGWQWGGLGLWVTRPEPCVDQVWVLTGFESVWMWQEARSTGSTPSGCGCGRQCDGRTRCHHQSPGPFTSHVRGVVPMEPTSPRGLMSTSRGPLCAVAAWGCPGHWGCVAGRPSLAPSGACVPCAGSSPSIRRPRPRTSPASSRRWVLAKLQSDCTQPLLSAQGPSRAGGQPWIQGRGACPLPGGGLSSRCPMSPASCGPGPPCRSPVWSTESLPASHPSHTVRTADRPLSPWRLLAADGAVSLV